MDNMKDSCTISNDELEKEEKRDICRVLNVMRLMKSIGANKLLTILNVGS